MRDAAPDGFITAGGAQDLLGVCKSTVTKLIKNGLLPAYTHRTNKRVVLVCLEDVERLRSPVPASVLRTDVYTAYYVRTNGTTAKYVSIPAGQATPAVAPEVSVNFTATVGENGWTPRPGNPELWDAVRSEFPEFRYPKEEAQVLDDE